MTEPCYLTPYLARFEERLSQRQQESLGDLKNAYRRYEGETLPSEEHLLILCAQLICDKKELKKKFISGNF